MAISKGRWRIGFKDGSGNGHAGVEVDGKYQYRGVWQGGAYITAGFPENMVVRGGEDDWGVSSGIQNEDDARLIAASPKLLRASKNLLNFVKRRFPKDFKKGGRGFVCPYHKALDRAVSEATKRE